jgi:broad specificity phosphatase PhoE
MGTLFLARHATTEASAGGRNLGQRSDPPLTDDGRSLAARLGRTLRAELAELPHDEIRLLSSPALRCRETAEAIAGAIGTTGALEVDDDLLELDYGAWDGLIAEECRVRDPELRAAWEADPFTTRCPEGEGGEDLLRRVTAALDPVVTWVAADRARCAIVVAHNHVNRVWLCACFGWPMPEYRERLSQDPAGYSLIGLGSRAPVIRRMNAAPA